MVELRHPAEVSAMTSEASAALYRNHRQGNHRPGQYAGVGCYLCAHPGADQAHAARLVALAGGRPLEEALEGLEEV